MYENVDITLQAGLHNTILCYKDASLLCPTRYDIKHSPFMVCKKLPKSNLQDGFLKDNCPKPRALVCEILKGHIGRCFPTAEGGVKELCNLSKPIDMYRSQMAREYVIMHASRYRGNKSDAM
jgi:hypothetical protein